ncbi:MAG TPA: hypothetical protein VE987_10630 [Polyangiaceae bacterium]|nr:hypothetical protein [Polyangiaceae bacterium]
MLKRVETARGLDAKKSVPGLLLDRAALIARVKEHVSRELPAEAIRNEGLTLELLGFVPTQFDYEAAEYRLLQDQLAGYYEPADGTMYMASDLADDEADATLAHELVHALQDQRWNLQERSKYRPGDGDRSEAVSALAEGDATSAMFDVIIARAAPGSGKTALDVPEDVFSEQIRQGMNQGSAAAAPQIMRSSLAAPYIYGTLFVNALRRHGGWEAVNRAWSDPPTTSEQIMHVDKWLAHEPAAHVGAPTCASLGAGWSVADEDSEGELGARVAFEQWLDPTAAAEASAGWGGDRGVLFSNGDRAAFAWRLRYDVDGDTKPGDTRASRAFRAITHGVDQSLGAPAVRDASFDCHERADRGPLAVSRSGTDIVFVAGPAKVSSGGPWTSAGSCALARKWLKEIASQPP